MNNARTAVVSGGTYKVNDGSAQAIYNHITFDRPVNADSMLTEKNDIFIDETYGLTVKAYVEELHKELQIAGTVRHKLYENAAISEFVARANGVYLKDGNAPDGFDLDGWAKATVKWADKVFNPPDHRIHFTNREGQEETREVQTIFAAVLHCDEATPHIHFLVTPITEDGRMSNKEVNSRDRFRQYQDSYHEAVKEFGLERGAKNSPAKNIDIKQYYKNITRAMSAEAPTIQSGETIEAYKGRCDEEIKACHCHMADQDRDHEREINREKAKLVTYIKDDYRLHVEVNAALGISHSHEFDMERIYDAGAKAKEKDLLDKALQDYPDRELAENIEIQNQMLISWQLEREEERNDHVR